MQIIYIIFSDHFGSLGSFRVILKKVVYKPVKVGVADVAHFISGNEQTAILISFSWCVCVPYSPERIYDLHFFYFFIPKFITAT